MKNIHNDITKGMNNMEDMKMFNFRFLGSIFGQATSISLMAHPWNIHAQGARRIRRIVHIVTNSMNNA